MHIVIEADCHNLESTFVYYIKDEQVDEHRARYVADGWDEVTRENLAEECNITNLTFPKNAFHITKVIQMAKEIFCKQCVLVRHHGKNSRTQTTSWVPEKLAIEGKLVTMDDEPEVWIVESVGTMKRNQKDLKEREKVHRKYRQITDV